MNLNKLHDFKCEPQLFSSVKKKLNIYIFFVFFNDIFDNFKSFAQKQTIKKIKPKIISLKKKFIAKTNE